MHKSKCTAQHHHLFALEPCRTVQLAAWTPGATSHLPLADTVPCSMIFDCLDKGADAVPGQPSFSLKIDPPMALLARALTRARLDTVNLDRTTAPDVQLAVKASNGLDTVGTFFTQPEILAKNFYRMKSIPTAYLNVTLVGVDSGRAPT